MNESVRWIVVLGCLCIAALEAPQCCLQLVQDAAGSYPSAPPTSSSSREQRSPVALAAHTVRPASIRMEEERALEPNGDHTDAGVRLASHR
jgi:hypothetical protein